MPIVFRASRRSDLIEGVWSLFNYGLANYRGSNVNATFGANGYNTHGLSSSTDPLVAFIYACIQARGAHEIAIFAINIGDSEAIAGFVPRQAVEQGVQPNSVTGRSVTEQREVVLASVARSSILGYYTVVVRRGMFFDLGAWTPVSGTATAQNNCRDVLKNSVLDYARRCGGLVSEQMNARELDRLMGH